MLGALNLSNEIPTAVIPAKAGIQYPRVELDPGLRRDDDGWAGRAFHWLMEMS